MDLGADTLTKHKLHNYRDTVQTQLEPYTKRVLVGEIPISTYFGEDAKIFYEENYDKDDFELNIDISLNDANVHVVKLEKLYQSDGVKIENRKPLFEDVIEVYAEVVIPVSYERRKEKGFFHLDLNPTPGHRHTVARNGFHRWIPSITSQETYELEEALSKELLVKQIHVYLKPAAIRYVNTSDVSIASDDGQIIPNTKRDKVLFHTDEEWWFNPKDYLYDETMLRLGKVMLQANSTMHDNMTILDTRTRGGGLDESLTKDVIKQVNEESLYHWDIGYFDGEAYQENGVIVIRIPRRVLKSEKNPNGFTEAQVEQAVAKHKTFGVLPIIEYYDDIKADSHFNIIPNPEFLHGQHIGYYDPIRSKGNYELYHTLIGSGDNYVLQLSDDAEYAITLPGHMFKSNTYRLDIKALKEHTATDRSAGTIEIFFRDGTKEEIQVSTISRNQWMVYKETLNIDPDTIHHVTITLNKTKEERKGRIIYDYVLLIPNPALSEETEEIHEI